MPALPPSSMSLLPTSRGPVRWGRARYRIARRVCAVRVIPNNKAAHSIFAARDPDNDLVLDRERSDREDVSLAVVGRLNVPDNVSGSPVESDHVRIERSHKELLTEHRETTIYHAAASLDFQRQMALVTPDRTSCACV